MSTDFRALCEELLGWAERTSSHYYKQPDVILRARAALAQPEPVWTEGICGDGAAILKDGVIKRRSNG